LKAGRDGGWAGPGIVSTTVKNDASGLKGIGYGESGDLLGLGGGGATAAWGGQTVDADALLVRPTYNGDLNLDGTVNRDDYARLDRARAKGLSGWGGGDFNYDGTTNAADFLMMDTAFATLHPGGLSPEFLAGRGAEFGEAYVSALAAAVPEPAAGVVGVAAVALAATGRRRRR
jgi:hypothetical protein